MATLSRINPQLEERFRAMGNFEFAPEIDVSGAEGISKSALENKIKETIRQIGASLRDETLE